MAYKTEELYSAAIEMIREKKLFFIEDIIAMLGIAKPTFYEHFKVGTNELNHLKELLNQNRVETKSSMRKKWFESDNATLQVALMKIIGTEEEAHRLNGSNIKLSGDAEAPISMVDYNKLSPETLKELINAASNRPDEG